MPEWIIILTRSVLLFIFVATVLRFIGRKQTTAMTFGDFVIGIAIGTIAALISANVITNLAFGLLALGVWVLLSILADYLALKSKIFHDLIRGRETILIKDGKVMEDNLKEIRYTGEELLSQLRRKNVFHMANVEFAVMEPNGEVNVLLKPEQTPITPKQLEWKVAPQSEPQTVILDGNIIDEGLRNQGVNRKWLQEQLDKVGISAENVFIGQVDSSGDFFVDLFDDAIQIPQPTTKQLLYATLKKCEADLELYALGTKNQQARKMYQESAYQLMEVISNLRVPLKR